MGLKQRPGRRSIRLAGYDYSQPGAYFVTICARDRETVFGQIVNGEMRPSRLGEVVEAAWRGIPAHFPRVELDGFCLMPNHIHGILVILDEGRGTACRAPTAGRFGRPTTGSLATIVRSFKSASTKRVNLMAGTPGNRVWQRNYYEHVIRDKSELERIRRYVELNPMRWEVDRENPAAPRRRPPQTNARKT